MDRLPGEIKEEILSHLVDSFNDDPVYQWTQLRHLSPVQMHRIKGHFQDHWLPHLSLTLYFYSTVDYNFVRVESHSDSAYAVFKRHDPINPFNPSMAPDPQRLESIKKSWDQFSFTNRNVTIRLGEGVLNKGFTGSYILNDTDLPGLTVDDDTVFIRFRWQEAVNELMREEMLLRKVTPAILEEKLNSLPYVDRSQTDETILLQQQIRVLSMEVQMARRVAVLKHRVKRTDPDGKLGFHFNRPSRNLHGQPVPEPSEEELSRAGSCACCSRLGTPDIFEVVSQEESIVPCLPIFQGWLRGTVSNMKVLDLAAEEFGWNCCRAMGFTNNLAWQMARRDNFRGTKGWVNYDEAIIGPDLSGSLLTDDKTRIPPTEKFYQDHIFKTGVRWDMLG